MSDYVVVLEDSGSTPVIYGPYNFEDAERVCEALVAENYVQRPLPFISIEPLARYDAQDDANG